MLPTYKNQHIETVMTYADWEKVYSRKQAQKKAEAIYYIKQKTFGFAMLCASLVEIALLHNNIIDEGGAFIFLLPIGIYALVTKKKICNF